jgi:hypothetical protein
VAGFYDAAVSGTDPVAQRKGFAAMLERIAGNGVRTIPGLDCALEVGANPFSDLALRIRRSPSVTQPGRRENAHEAFPLNGFLQSADVSESSVDTVSAVACHEHETLRL